MSKISVAVAYGDGIGPEIMKATLLVLNEAGVNIEWVPVEIGEKVYNEGHLTGVSPAAWDVIRSTNAFLKAPITTPQGGGIKSVNVTIRTTLGLFANIRHCISYAPFIQTKHPEMDVVIVRENEEDLYLGIEYQQTPCMTHAIKCISQEGSEKIIRYAFDYARQHGRKKVSCFTKDNILKLSDGLFHKVFSSVAQEFLDIESEHLIVDIGAAKLANKPELFDVIVLPNLYGDILSDVAAEISGSVGLVGSVNIGDRGAMFEAIHGSAPKLAGKNIANPSALLLSAIAMLSYLGKNTVAKKIHNAWLYTIEKGTHTQDIFNEGRSSLLVGTMEFARAVIGNFEKEPQVLKPVCYQSKEPSSVMVSCLGEKHITRELVGCDLYVYAREESETFMQRVLSLSLHCFRLDAVFNRGVCIWPQGYPETSCSEQWRLRFIAQDKETLLQKELVSLQKDLIESGFDIIRVENLYEIAGVPGFSAIGS